MIIFQINLTYLQFQILKTAAIIDTNMFRLVNPCLESKVSIVDELISSTNSKLVVHHKIRTV